MGSRKKSQKVQKEPLGRDDGITRWMNDNAAWFPPLALFFASFAPLCG
jgi:hypothetical protein